MFWPGRAGRGSAAPVQLEERLGSRGTGLPPAWAVQAQDKQERWGTPYGLALSLAA
jgi:hypothetical protein